MVLTKSMLSAAGLSAASVDLGGRLWRFVKKWWVVTTDEAYLTSSQSHRTSWSRLFPYCALTYAFFYASNILLANSTFLRQHSLAFLTLIATFFIAARVPTRTLLPDLIVICPSIVCSQICVDVLDIPFFLALPQVAMSQGALGFHSVVVALYSAYMAVYVSTCSEISSFEAIMVTNMFAFGVVATSVNQFYSASMHKQWTTQLMTSQRLLDIATDGFCSIDPVTATITSASSQFMLTFGDEGIVGARLTDFVAAEDAEMLMRHVNEGVCKDVMELAPMMATCHQKCSDTSEQKCLFDARFVLFASNSEHVQLFLNVIGERRSLHVSAESPQGGVKAAERQTVPADELERLASISELGDGIPAVKGHGSDLSCSLVLSESSVFNSSTSASRTSRPRVATQSVGTQTVATGARPPRQPQRQRRVNLATKKLVSRKFLETPPMTIRQIILDNLWRMNPRGKGCCIHHIKLECLLRQTSELLSHSCTNYPDIDDAFQCRRCFAINGGKDMDAAFCDVCDADFDDSDERSGQHPSYSSNAEASSCDADCSSSDHEK
eukprot:TRINITY_DN48663_c0_g1_i1.p1 TRINITY_DN48663_c0_g1~~TRINITY_DN48663_c0_g1_i1.p1  ORF type:complete len:572 (-),score=46.80 TRINITY_DN48663_c0_g1_i1:239-1894(-)